MDEAAERATKWAGSTAYLLLNGVVTVGFLSYAAFTWKWDFSTLLLTGAFTVTTQFQTILQIRTAQRAQERDEEYDRRQEERTKKILEAVKELTRAVPEANEVCDEEG